MVCFLFFFFFFNRTFSECQHLINNLNCEKHIFACGSTVQCVCDYVTVYVDDVASFHSFHSASVSSVPFSLAHLECCEKKIKI